MISPPRKPRISSHHPTYTDVDIINTVQYLRDCRFKSQIHYRSTLRDVHHANYANYANVYYVSPVLTTALFLEENYSYHRSTMEGIHHHSYTDVDIISTIVPTSVPTSLESRRKFKCIAG